MTRDVDLLMATEVNKFKPTERQMAVKLVLLKNAPERILTTLSLASIDCIAQYISPYDIKEVISWAESHPAFLEWLLAPDSYEVSLHMVKEEALAVVKDILSADSYDQEINPKLLAVKLKAAEFVLNGPAQRNQPKTVNNKLNLYGRVIPKHLASKSEDALEAELLKLERAK